MNFKLKGDPAAKIVKVEVELARPATPGEIQVKMRLPKSSGAKQVMVNGRPANFSGPRYDTVIVKTAGEERFELVASYS